MFALTIDQRGSRGGDDQVPRLLGDVAQVPVFRGFERTAGDEVQGLCDTADAVVDVVVAAARSAGWWIGVGIGQVDAPVPGSVRAARGTALFAARAAVERSDRAAYGVAVEPGDPRAPGAAEAVEDAEIVLQVLARIVADRSPEGDAAVEAMERHPTQAAAARELGISAQAMSRRLQAARRHDESRLRVLAVRLLERADVACRTGVA